MSELLPVVPPRSDEAIQDDLFCLQCGYNLRTLRPSGLCPECGTPVAKSLEGNPLHFADSNWLRRVKGGASLTAWSLLLIMIIYLLFVFLIITVTMATVSSASGPPRDLIGFFAILPGCMIIICLILLLIGIGRLSLREPNPRQPESAFSYRKMVIYCIVAGFASFVMMITANAINNQILLIPAMLLTIFAYLTPFVMCGMIRQFFLRVPDFSRAKQCRILGWGWLILIYLPMLVVILAITVITALGHNVVPTRTGTVAVNHQVITALGHNVVPTPTARPLVSSASTTMPTIAPLPSSVGLFAGGLYCLVLVAGLIFTIWSLILLFRLRSTLSLAYEQSLEYHNRRAAGNNTGTITT